MLTLGDKGFPDKLANIPDPPKQLYVLGDNFLKLLEHPCLAVVGSRKVTAYGRSVTSKLTEEAARQGMVIISGLALGIDGLAHEAALKAGTQTIAVLPSGLEHVYPSTHHHLANEIVKQGGALVTEYPGGTVSFKTNFVARNRLISGLSDGVLIPEAAERSGSLHTANFALEQGREVMAVPGNITSPMSAGTNMLIKTGATPVTAVEDILRALKLEHKRTEEHDIVATNEQEYIILTLIKEGVNEGDNLMSRSGLSPAIFNQTLTMLEITGKIKNLGANHWTLS